MTGHELMHTLGRAGFQQLALDVFVGKSTGQRRQQSQISPRLIDGDGDKTDEADPAPVVAGGKIDGPITDPEGEAEAPDGAAAGVRQRHLAVEDRGHQILPLQNRLKKAQAVIHHSPLVQPIDEELLRKRVRDAVSDAGSVMAAARDEVKSQTGADQITTATITRFTRNQIIQMVLLVALVYVAYPFISSVPVFFSELRNANWWWALAAAAAHCGAAR